jgi:hypothetical protein
LPDEYHGPPGPHRLKDSYGYTGRQSGEIPVPRTLRGWQARQMAGRPMTLEEYRMTEANPLTQPGGAGPDQTTRHSAEHVGSYAHRPAPHLEPSPVIPGDNLEYLAVADLEKAAREAAERDAEIDRRITAARE